MRSARTSSDAASPPPPPLARVRVDGITRGSFILRGALATAALYGAGAAGPFVRDALAQSDATDAQILDFALRLETLEAAFYEQALKQVPGLSAGVRSIARLLGAHEREHRRVLGETVSQIGIRTSPPPRIQFGDAFASEARFLQTAQLLEDTGVSAYNGAAAMLFSRSLLSVAGSIVQVEARHAAVVRDLRGEPVAAAAFEKPERPEQVAAVIRPFVRG